MTLMNRVDKMRLRAYELARSGRHADWLSVKEALENEGCPDARFALDNPIIRAHVEGLCGEHWQVKGPSARPARNLHGCREQKPA